MGVARGQRGNAAKSQEEMDGKTTPGTVPVTNESENRHKELIMVDSW